jgi:hypothetical protein
MTKILFLDFDGVLNSTHWAGQRPRRGLLPPESARQAVEEQRLDPSCVDRLKRLVHLTHASIVITSSWRQNMALSEMVKMFALYEFTDAPLISVTENLSCSRGIEVAAWLQANADDDADFAGHPLVQTNTDLGLQESDVQACRVILDAMARSTQGAPHS